MTGRTDDEEEDPQYLKVKEYITLLEGHLTEAHRQATRIIKKQTKMADALEGFGSSAQSLSTLEDGHVQTSFQLVGAKAEELARITAEQTAQLNATFEEPLKEFCRYVKCVKSVMADRASAMSAYQQIKQDAWGKRNKLTKLKGKLLLHLPLPSLAACLVSTLVRLIAQPVHTAGFFFLPVSSFQFLQPLTPFLPSEPSPIQLVSPFPCSPAVQLSFVPLALPPFSGSRVQNSCVAFPSPVFPSTRSTPLTHRAHVSHPSTG
eukprot:CAMPEP_0117670296 /NCGR_PEP_ID=MMETSP0804-20121206/12664_1 /TAXON_ID=1074897 /ORGANISM="Tetraselmis astigmatica, Strain CCMP880" /LENGTH=261 /DNA_ID=CAMNT_0005478559 /DNA_START=492 /DNA_END=1277 /DNA_ORIENTATION=-